MFIYLLFGRGSVCFFAVWARGGGGGDGRVVFLLLGRGSCLFF